jgi:hypothetical protein
MMFGRCRSLLLISGLALLSANAGAADVKSYAGTYQGRIPLEAGSCDTPDRIFNLVVDQRGAARMLFYRRSGNSLRGLVDNTGAVKLSLLMKIGRMDLVGTIDGKRLVGKMTSDQGCTWTIDLKRA